MTAEKVKPLKNNALIAYQAENDRHWDVLQLRLLSLFVPSRACYRQVGHVRRQVGEEMLGLHAVIFGAGRYV